MSKADDIFWREFGVILLLLAAFGVMMFFVARGIGSDAFERAQSGGDVVASRIAPVGQVRVGDPGKQTVAAPVQVAAASATAEPRSGSDVYAAACVACHASGAAGAPKLGDAAAWTPRVAQGLDTLVANVVKGKGAMPPKAGNPSLTEGEIRDAVVHMLEQTGIKVATAAVESVTATAQTAVKALAAAAASTAAAETSDSALDLESGGGTYGKACVACHSTGAAGAPKLTDKAAWEPRLGQGFDALVGSALKGKGAMPPKGGFMSLQESDIRNAVGYMLDKAGVKTDG